MDTVNNLLEGASPYQVLQNQAAKLSGKWDKSGLLEGIESSTDKNNMAILLENQAKQLVNEASSVGTETSITTGNSEAWAGVALPLVRRVFGEIVAKDLVSVQPMNLPAGLIFYLDFQYGTAQNFKALNESLYGATADLKRTDVANDKGLYGAGEFGYSITQSSQTFTNNASGLTDEYSHLDSNGNEGSISGSSQIGTASVSLTGILNNDTEFSASNAGTFGNDTAADTIRVFRFATGSLTDFDPEAIRAFQISSGGFGLGNGTGIVQPQFTRIVGGELQVVAKGAAAADADETGASIDVVYLKGPDNLNDRGDFEDSIPAAGVSNQQIPEINVQLRSDTVAAKTRKLKAQWTPEFAQDLNAYHSIDAEAELTSILSEYISMEIDLEILDMLIRNADTVEAWSADINKEMTVSTNDTAGGTTAITFSSTVNDMGTYYTKMSWFQTLGVKLQKVSNLIHQKTLRGGANFLVVSPKVSTILESIPGFAADSAGEQNKYNMGVQKIGAINNRYTVYKNPYMKENTILMGYKGSQFLETGAVFAPYIPLIMTPLVYDPVSFTPRKGIMTRYAKKMVRPDFYGKVFIADLNKL
jgi:hypothetical protein